MDWTEDYLRQCLRDIPKGKYARRLRRELEDHLSLLAEDLRHAGRSEAEAHAEALRQMGDAASLNERCWAEWLRQPERLRSDLARLFSGCLLAGVSGMLGFGLYLSISVGVATIRHASYLSPSGWFLLFGVILFFSAFLPNAIYLREVFRKRRDRTALTICGMLLSWAVGKGITGLGLLCLWGGRQPFPDSVRGLLTPLIGFEDLLWFRWPLIALSLLGCVALGWLFGRENQRKETEAAKNEKE